LCLGSGRVALRWGRMADVNAPCFFEAAARDRRAVGWILWAALGILLAGVEGLLPRSWWAWV